MKKSGCWESSIFHQPKSLFSLGTRASLVVYQVPSVSFLSCVQLSSPFAMTNSTASLSVPVLM